MTGTKEKAQDWVKRGRIFDPGVHCAKGYTHGANPVVYRVKGSLCCVLFTSRDSQGYSHIFRASFDLSDPKGTFEAEKEPALSPGRPGHFDDAGVMATNAFVADGGRTFVLYVGWNSGSKVPFRNALGLASVFEDGQIQRIWQGPILDRSIYDPCFIASACAVKISEQYLLYYTSGEDWIKEDDGNLMHKYRLKIARSADLKEWKREGELVVDYASLTESCITCPTVINHDGRYKMWFSYRGDQYRIGFADSSDGLTWHRNDELVELRPGDDEWESHAVSYPNVFALDNRIYMLYCGNDYGKTGFGLATLNLA